jgi:hypothetical protein
MAVAVALGSFDRRDPVDGAGLHALVRRFRDGDPNAATVAVRGVIDLLAREPELRSPAVAAIAVPAHDGQAGDALVALVTRVATDAGWHVPGSYALVRQTAVPEAKRRPPRDPAADLASLRWYGEAVPGDVTTILLVDDVLASGATLSACRDALRRDGWRGGVRALVLARSG